MSRITDVDGVLQVFSDELFALGDQELHVISWNEVKEMDEHEMLECLAFKANELFNSPTSDGLTPKVAAAEWCKHQKQLEP